MYYINAMGIHGDMGLEIEIIYSDAYLLVINKPSGLLSIPDGYDPTLPHVRSLLESEWGRLYSLHRLDKETSGALILARDADTHRTMNLLFDSRAIKKQYLCLVLGHPTWDNWDERTSLLVNGDRDHRTVANFSKGKTARTFFHVQKHLQGVDLLKAELFSGLTHQIRAHSSHLGFPILFDPLYTRSIYKSSMQTYEALLAGSGYQKRLMLHAFQLTFTHPVTSQPIVVSIPPPSDFACLVDLLK